MRVIYPFLIFAGISLLVLPVAVPVIKTSAEFSIFNTGWNGCSSFAKALAERGELIPIIYPYTSVKLGNLNGVLLIVGPDVGFSEHEAEEVRKFLMRGGTVFIADDFGTSNELLEMLGVNVRFSKQPLRDLFYSKNEKFPVVVRIHDPYLGRGVERIVLNIPAAIVHGSGEAFTSKVSVVGNTVKSFPVLAEIQYGNGRLVLLSDPGVLINDMYGENGKFVENLIEYLGTKFYYDEAHHSDFNPYSTGTVYIHRELDRNSAFLVFLSVAALALLVESGAVGKISGKIIKLLPKIEENLLESLPPDVDVEVVMKMLEEIRTGSRLGGEYGRKGVYGAVKK